MGSRIARIEEAPWQDVESCAASQASNDRRWRRALWIALGINVGILAGEMVAGLAANWQALQARRARVFGDAANYTINLGVAGMALV